LPLYRQASKLKVHISSLFSSTDGTSVCEEYGHDVFLVFSVNKRFSPDAGHKRSKYPEFQASRKATSFEIHENMTALTLSYSLSSSKTYISSAKFAKVLSR